VKQAIEEWARLVVRHALGVEVEHHDDGSQPSMYDLRVGPVAEPQVAVEVTMAADERRMAAATLLSGEAIPAPSLTGTWVVDLHPRTRLKHVYLRLEPILADLEANYAPEQLIDHRGLLPSDVRRLERVGVATAHRGTGPGSGQIYVKLSGQGGIVDRDGTALSEWIGEFLTSVPDVLHKLRISAAPARHAFIPVMFSAAPWAAESFLGEFPMPDGSTSPPPTAAPRLPEPVTHVWVTTTFARRGWRWDGEAWQQFQAAGAPIDDR
jgi:hypothetical protein